MSKRKKTRTHSTLSEHHRQGKILTPPLLKVIQETPNSKLQSWMNERLPNMLWAALLVTGLDRDQALNLFRRVAEYGQKFEEFSQRVDISHSGLQGFDEESQRDI